MGYNYHPQSFDNKYNPRGENSQGKDKWQQSTNNK